MSEQVKLEPCPFCGGEATLERACLVRNTYHWVTCRNELCVVKCHGFQSLTERDAIAAWNRRASAGEWNAAIEAAARYHAQALRHRHPHTAQGAMTMALGAIKATFYCDGCGCEFRVTLDAATPVRRDRTFFDIAVDEVRGGMCEVTAAPTTMRWTNVGHCSVQNDKHLCPKCTREADEKDDPDDE